MYTNAELIPDFILYSTVDRKKELFFEQVLMEPKYIRKQLLTLSMTALAFLTSAVTLYTFSDEISEKLGTRATTLGIFILLVLLLLSVIYGVLYYRIVFESYERVEKRKEDLEAELTNRRIELEEDLSERKSELEEEFSNRRAALEEEKSKRRGELEGEYSQRRNHLEKEYSRKKREVQKRTEKLERIMRDQVEKLELVVEKIYPAYQSPTYKILEARYIVMIDETGTVQEKKQQTIEVVTDAPLHFTHTWVEVDEFAPEADFFEDIKLEARGFSGQEVCLLPIKNRPRKKKGTLFFLPRITKKNGPVKFEVSYEWENAMSGLLKRGKDRWWREFDHHINKLHFEFHISELLKPRDVAYRSMTYEGGELLKREEAVGDYRRFIFTIDGASGDSEDRTYSFDIISENVNSISR